MEEVIPSLDENWLAGPGGRYVAEFVVSLVLRDTSRRAETTAKPRALVQSAMPAIFPSPAPAVNRLLPPGSDWLFVKLYGPSDFEDDLIAQRLRPFAESALSDGLADKWFFIRYSDPDPHLRIRFHGAPETLTSELLPAISKWAGELMADDLCHRFCFDTYDR